MIEAQGLKKKFDHVIAATNRVAARDRHVLATRPSIRAIRYVGRHQILREGSLVSPVTSSFFSFCSCRVFLVGILPKRILGLPLRASGSWR